MSKQDKNHIVELKITYLPVQPADNFKRCGKLRSPAYLWCRRDNKEDPITSVRVMQGDAHPGEDFEKVDNDIHRTDPNIFFWVSKKAEGSPIIDFTVIDTTDLTVPPGFVKIDSALNPNSTPLEYLCYKTVETKAKLEASDYNKGDMLDVKDTTNRWLVGSVREVDEEKRQLLIHYEGWADRWDEWISKKSNRLAPHRSKTQGKKTGWHGDKNAAHLAERISEFEDISNRLNQIYEKVSNYDQQGNEGINNVSEGKMDKSLENDPEPGLEGKEEKKGEEKKGEEKMEKSVDPGMSNAEYTFVVEGANYIFIDFVLSCIIDGADHQSDVQAYLEKNILFILRAINSETDIAENYLKSLMVIFDSDHSNDRRFYRKYGSDMPNENAQGQFAERPNLRTGNPEDNVAASYYLIRSINLFGEKGGFDAIKTRLLDAKTQSAQNNKRSSFFTVAKSD